MPTKRLILIIALALVALVFVAFGQKGWLTVEVDGATTITATNSNVKYEGKQSFSRLVSPGDYIVEVSNGSFSSQYQTHVSLFGSTRLAATIRPTKAAVAVSSGGASFMNPRSDSLVFVDGSDSLAVINSQSATVTPFRPELGKVSFAQWSGNGQGVLIATKNDVQHAYRSNGDVFEELDTASLGQGAALDATITPSGKILISKGKNVYEFDNGVKTGIIYTSEFDNFNIVASNEWLVIYYPPGGSTETNVGSGENIAINLKTKRHTKFTTGVDTLDFSPDGKKVAITGSRPVIQDVSGNNILSLADGAHNYHWISNSTLVYSINDSLWYADTSNKGIYKMSNTPGGALISSVSTDPAGNIYFATGSDIESWIFRVPVKLTNDSNLSLALQKIIPVQGNNYKITMYNWDHPIIKVFSTDTVAKSEALDDLISRGIDLNKYQIVYTTISE